MRSKNIHWFIAFTLIGLFSVILHSCSEDEVQPDEDTPGKVFDIDGNKYKTVIIGNHEWMAENLRVTRYSNGDSISTGLSDAEWRDTMEGAYSIYPHTGGLADDDVEGIHSDAEMVDAYGKLYNWYAVNDPRGLCPAGWSVPSEGVWRDLVNYLTDNGFPNEMDNPNGATNALKSCWQADAPLDSCRTYDHPRWNAHSLHQGFDEFGFSALPAGRRRFYGVLYERIGTGAFWWTSSRYYSTTQAWRRSMGSSVSYLYRGNDEKTNGYSVRCIRAIEN